MQNELEKAREQYGLVTGAYANYAKAQAERLATPEAIETYAWLSKAQPPRPVAPMGPGTPGQGPAFSPSDISLPNANQANPARHRRSQERCRSVRCAPERNAKGLEDERKDRRTLQRSTTGDGRKPNGTAGNARRRCTAGRNKSR